MVPVEDDYRKVKELLMLVIPHQRAQYLFNLCVVSLNGNILQWRSRQNRELSFLGLLSDAGLLSCCFFLCWYFCLLSVCGLLI